MSRKAVAIVILGVCYVTSNCSASEPNDYLVPGRALLFDGSLSGMRGAYALFDDGIKDANCAECTADRELRFSRALAGTVMLLFADDDQPVNSVLELAREFGVELTGEQWGPYFEPNTLCYDYNDVRNQHNIYELPDTAPDKNDLRNIIDTSLIPEIDKIIEDLNSITDLPGDRFRTYLQPDELRIFFHIDSSFADPNSPSYAPRFLNPLEVDYGEVLLLKGVLTRLKVQLQANNAYDTYVDPNDNLLEKYYANVLEYDKDILQVYPEFLNILPTGNDSNDGAAILAQARDEYIEAINFYIDAITYIENEDNPPGTDPQDDELLYLDPNDKEVSDAVIDRLTKVRDSLLNDTADLYPVKKTKIYELVDPCSTTWTLTLNYDIVEMSASRPGSFVASDNNSAPSPWKITYIRQDGNELMIEMDYDVPGNMGGAFFTGTLSSDQNTISDGELSYWGPGYGTLGGFAGPFISTELIERQLDLNPLFGSTARYPGPVNPRNLLPEFDKFNSALPNTLGHGLGNDATLGGILPDMNQYEWQKELNLQPSGLIYLSYASPWQITVDGNLYDWTYDQMVFEDITGEIDEESEDFNGVDIKALYMAYDWDNFYGAIELSNNTDINNDYYYSLYLSYSHENRSAGDALKITIVIDGGNCYGYLYHAKIYENGWTMWENTGAQITRASDGNSIEFSIPFSEIPSYLPGRYITINSIGYDNNGFFDNGEKNKTHLQIGNVGTISGEVTYDCYKTGPIVVEAYTDPADPEGSLVSRTMIEEPGPYTLESIGLGWYGYVRAYTPLFGFDNLFEMSALEVLPEAVLPVYLMASTTDIDITLEHPKRLKKDIWQSGEINSKTKPVKWHYFDAVEGGTYTIDLTPITASYAYIALYDRDASTELIEVFPWDTQHIDFSCLSSGRYYVKIQNSYYEPHDETYQIMMSSDLTCPQADIACAEWAGVKDCKVDSHDLGAFATHWLEDCSASCPCDGSDFDESGEVNFIDFAILADEWMLSGI